MDKRKIVYRGPDLSKEFKDAIKREVALPRHPQRRMEYLADSKETFLKHGDSVVFDGFPRSATSRDGIIKQAQLGSRDAIMARPRYYDPIRSYTLLGIPFQTQLEAERVKIRQWCRFYFMTHHLVPTCIEIFARFPLIGFSNVCKDNDIQNFYDELFLDESRLNYQNFLVQLGLEYWLIGETFAYGDWSNDLGVWVSDQLLDPDLVEVEYYPMLKSRAFRMKIPDHLKKLVQEKRPQKEYEILVTKYPDMIPYIQRNEPIPIDNDCIRQLKCGGAEWDSHGTPILMRAFRQLMLEEKLNMAQMAIAERMYLPLLVGKLGSQGYGPDNNVWIPTQSQLSALRDDIELAMSSDFRFIATHWAVEFQSVFGREVVPDLNADYDQIERRVLAVFGISQSLVSGESSTPYASTALNADFLNQRLKSYQNELKTFIKDRYRAVAEAQEFYDYEKKGSRYVPIMEEHLYYDMETGETKKEVKHKLLYPEPVMRILDLRDEATQREFLFKLREAGVPISDSSMMVGVDFDFEDELERRLDQERQKIVAQQQSNKRLYAQLKEANLPIPVWLKAEVSGIPQEEGEPRQMHTPSSFAPDFDMGGIEGMESPVGPPEIGEGEMGPEALPNERMRPEESSEEMEGMPMAPASLDKKMEKTS